MILGSSRRKQSLTVVGFLVVLGICGWMMTGCEGRDSGTKLARQNPPRAAAFRVAMLLPGPIDDHSWNQSGYEGLLEIEKTLGAGVAYTADVNETQSENLFREYARQGFDFIIGLGGEYVKAAEKVADEFPLSKFAVVSNYPGNNRNLGALSFRFGEIDYLCGVTAGLKTRSGHIALIAGTPLFGVTKMLEYFEKGVESVNADARVTVDWVGNWSDGDKARELARARIEQGADVLVPVADAAGRTVFEEGRDAEVWLIGWAADQRDLAPHQVVTSGIQRLPVVLLKGTALVQEGRWEGKQYNFGMAEGAQNLAPFHGMLTPEQEARVLSIRRDMLRGNMTPAQ